MVGTLFGVGGFEGLLDRLDSDVGRRGREFERVVAWWLRHDPRYAAQVGRVWLWDEWPGRWGVDAGIDLVAETVDGELWAVQAKAYAPDYSVTKRDIDSFLSESARPNFSYRLLVATTNRIGANARRTLDAQGQPVGLVMRSDLARVDVVWPESPEDLHAPRPERKLPRPHQREAVEAVVGGFADTDRGQLIMACGTGKTLTALFVAEALASHKTLVLVPSLSLLAQTLREWTANAAGPFRFLAVCSDETVLGEDHLVSHTSELGVPVTTDPETIARFLKNRARMVVFSTYQSVPKIVQAQAQDGVPRFDLVIADEAHRVAGPVSSEFATVLDGTALRGDRRLFMTATPRFFTGRVLREAKESDFEVASMDDTTRFGPVFHTLTFGEAIRRDLLTDYQVVIVGVDDPTIYRQVEEGRLVTRDGREVTDARTLASHVALAKAMRDYDLRRVISFHGRVARARRFALDFPDVVGWMPEAERLDGRLVADFVSGEMPSGQRDVRLDRLRSLDEGERGLLANARCLGEGVDLPTLDGVAFIDPRGSQVDIIQAVGRAIRKAENKRVGTIVLPVFITAREDPEQAIHASAFKPVGDVLRALRAHDGHLAEELDQIRRALGRVGSGAVVLPAKLVIDLPTAIGMEFAAALATRLVDSSTARWEEMFGLLCRFAAREGDAAVPAKHEENGLKLGVWVGVQRREYAAGELPARYQDLLEGLPGWSFHPHEDAWDEGLQNLSVFANREGHTLVPRGHTEAHFRLDSWVTKQRQAYRTGQLGGQRVRKLEAMPGWSWAPHDDAWERGLNALKAFAEREGHTAVPSGHREGGYPLDAWVNKQRSDHRRGTLEAARVNVLEAIPGWVWSARDLRWDEGMNALAIFVSRTGHSRVTAGHREGGYPLGSWVSTQRSFFKRGKLAVDRVAALERLPGWVWDAQEATFAQGLDALSSFSRRHGHTSVPVTHVEDGFPLAQWVQRQRQRFKAGTLAPDRASVLAALPGWSWNPFSTTWEAHFSALQRFADRQGHTRVPSQYSDGPLALGRWVVKQRAAYGAGRIQTDRSGLLESLPGWTWDTREAAWERAYELLERFAEREGHTQVPYEHLENGFRLGAWASKQRQAHKQGRLNESRISRLESLPHWTWSSSQ